MANTLNKEDYYIRDYIDGFARVERRTDKKCNL